MKKVMFFLSALVVGVGFANAAPAISVKSNVITVNQDDKEKIKAEDLPEAVKTTLNGDEYTGWLIQSAHKIKSKDQYEVELKKGAETKTVKLDKDGKIVA
jgi:hypothetical protein